MIINKCLLWTNWNPPCLRFRFLAHSKIIYSKFESEYSENQKCKILRVINESDTNSLSNYDITKTRLKNFTKWKKSNGSIKSISDIEMIDGFTEKTIKKLLDSIVNDQNVKKEVKQSNAIKGQFLHPLLTENARKNCTKVLAVYVTASSICWSLIKKKNYEVLEWKYYGIDYPDGRKFQITDIMDVVWQVTQKLPSADIYVMKAEATTLRASGNDPNNPKLLAVNLQKSQMVAMIVALLNARGYSDAIDDMEDHTASDDKLKQKVYFLRPTLPFRLFNTLVGNERVSTDQTLEMLLPEFSNVSSDNSHVYIPLGIQSKFRSMNELERDMMGCCLFLALTFMDVCIYENQDSILKLSKSN